MIAFTLIFVKNSRRNFGAFINLYRTFQAPYRRTSRAETETNLPMISRSEIGEILSRFGIINHVSVETTNAAIRLKKKAVMSEFLIRGK